MSEIAAAPAPPRSPWQLFYGCMHRLRWQWYARRASRLPVPVVSVGNLHWGGTGKTPLVAAIARWLQDSGRIVCILSRGYGAKGSGIRVVSTGEGRLLGPDSAGDEPVLLADMLPGISVVVGPERDLAGRRALEILSPRPEIFILDDGFSHLRLFRDIDLVVFPADDPWAGGRLLPSGRLREPLSSLARADAVILNGATPSQAGSFAVSLERFGFTGSGFAAAIRPTRPRLLGGEIVKSESSVLIVTAIARPRRVVDTARELGYRIADVVTFADHHPYPDASLRAIEDAYRQSEASVVVTTSKDMVKLAGRLDAPLAELAIRAVPDADLYVWLERRLQQLQRAGSP